MTQRAPLGHPFLKKPYAELEKGALQWATKVNVVYGPGTLKL